MKNNQKSDVFTITQRMVKTYQGHTVSNLLCLTEKDMVKQAMNMMKNGKTPDPSSVISEMVNAVGETGV